MIFLKLVLSLAIVESCGVNPNPYKIHKDSLLAPAGRDLKQASTKDLATSFANALATCVLLTIDNMLLGAQWTGEQQ